MTSHEKKQRTIVITGASGGLAQAIVKALPKQDRVILLGRQQERLETLYATHPNAVCRSYDIADMDLLETLIEELHQQYGPIDCFINNAGYGCFKNYQDFSNQEIRDMFAVNTFATMAFSRLIGQKMTAQGYGHIINIASMAGLIASNKSSLYSATKFAVIGFSNALRLELAAKSVFVTTVNPGPIKTSFFDQADPSGDYLKSVGRFALEPEQVANRIVKAIGKNVRDINMPFSLKLTHQFYTLFPKVSDFLARSVFNFK